MDAGLFGFGNVLVTYKDVHRVQYPHTKTQVELDDVTTMESKL